MSIKLKDQKNWTASVEVAYRIVTDLIDDGFPLNIGAVVITSSDKLRNFVIDSESTDYTNPQRSGTVLSFVSNLEEDLETFPVDEEHNYELLVADLPTATASFYCSGCDMEDPDSLDWDGVKAHVVIDIDGVEYNIKPQIDG